MAIGIDGCRIKKNVQYYNMPCAGCPVCCVRAHIRECLTLTRHYMMMMASMCILYASRAHCRLVYLVAAYIRWVWLSNDLGYDRRCVICSFFYLSIKNENVKITIDDWQEAEKGLIYITYLSGLFVFVCQCRFSFQFLSVDVDTKIIICIMFVFIHEKRIEKGMNKWNERKKDRE